MRKRLSMVMVSAFLVCAAFPAAAQAEDIATPETTAEQTAPAPEAAVALLDLDSEENGLVVYDVAPQDDVVSDPVAKIGDAGYATLQEAINAAQSGEVITLQRDLTLTEGLRFTGPQNAAAADWTDITLDAAKHSLTLNGKGIYATRCKVTIKDCPALTVHAGTSPEGIAAVLFAPGTLILDNCDTVNIMNLEPNTSGGSGLCIYNGGDLYIQNKTHFTVSGFMNPGPAGKDGCSGIYMDSDEDVNEDYTKIMGEIVVSDNSTLTATKCHHNGITANPVNITVTGNSKIDVNHNNDDWAGYGGLGCYYGTLTVSDHSLVTAYNNTAYQFAVFVDGLDVDGTSKVNVADNGNNIYGGTGIAISGKGFLRSGAELTSSGNWGPGVQVFSYLDDNDNFISGGSLTVESGATLSSCKNYNYGLANGYNLNINPGAHVYLNENVYGGLDNYPYATTTVDAGADLVITNNYGRGIKNGNSDPKRFSDKPDAVAKLVLNAGLITENGKRQADFVDYGAGIYNEHGSVAISSNAKIYNNKASDAGDDLYNCDDVSSNTVVITVVPGANGCVLDDDKYIDYWYKDGSGAPRWDENNALQYTQISLGLGEALKAAHNINAKPYVPEPEQPDEPKPNPDPEPKPDPKPEPKPDPAPVTPAPVEPSTSPEPDVTPTPTPTASPAPTAAPAAPATTEATATPAPTAAPTAAPKAKAAPAAAPAAIPQTGDTLPLVPLELAALGSAAALCVLQKRRKSK